MSAPVVSVLMPVFNAASTLDAALDSLRAQTLQEIEVVAVDDGSDDDSLLILENRRRDFPQLSPVPIDHSGLIDALNRGVEHCRGQFIARMDADDLCHPQRLEKQLELLLGDNSVSVASSLVETFPRDCVREGMRIYEAWLNSLVTPDDIRREMFIESPIPHPTAMVRRHELCELGGYRDFGWPEDYDLWLRYFVAGKQFAKVPEVLLSWREHPDRLTHTDSRYSVENFLRAKAHYLLQGPLRGSDEIIVWGAGKTGRRLSKHLLRGGAHLTAFVDIADDKVGRSMRGAPIIAVEELASTWRHCQNPTLLVAVASRGARALIRTKLQELELVEGHDYWCVA
jgi:glycosyltransferase involved in cell wall biosynthesis